MIFLSVIYLYNYVNMTNYINFNRPLPSSGNPHFQNEAKCTAFLVLCLHEIREWKIIFKSKVSEHLALFWYRGPGELGKGWFLFAHGIDCLKLCLFLSDTKRFYITYGSYISWGIYLERFFYRCKYIHSTL